MLTMTTTTPAGGAADQDAMGQSIMQHLHQVLLLNSDPLSLLNSIEGDDYLELLAPVLEDAVNSDHVEFLVNRLAEITAEKEVEVQTLCNENQQEYTKAVKQLAKVKKKSEQMRSAVLNVNQSLQHSGRALVSRRKLLEESQNARKNVDEVTSALNRCLGVLNLTNKIHEMIEQKKYFSALKSLDDLQKNHLQEVDQFQFAQLIRNSVPVIRDTIRNDVMGDLNVWVAGVLEIAPEIGLFAFSVTESKRRKWKLHVEESPQLRYYKLNSAVELALENDDDIDPLDNKSIHVELMPFYETMHICTALGVLDKFGEQYALDRVKDRDKLLPQSIVFTDDNVAPLEHLLHTVCGFEIVERATVRMAYQVRTPESVGELWESICQRIEHLIDPVLPTLSNPDTLLRVRTLLGLFIQTMERYDYSVARLNKYMLSLFNSYSAFLKQRFAQEFQQTVLEDDYMPMSVNRPELWERVISICWYKPDLEVSHVQFPCTLPFSQVYPLSCAEIRHFVEQHYQFVDEYTEQLPGQVEETLRISLDELLTNVVCKTLCDRLRSNNRQQIVQIFINLEYFELASHELERMLNEGATVPHAESIVLQAATEFANARKIAEKRVFELVNSAIDDFIDIASYDWETSKVNTQPSSYLIDMVNFLETLVNETLVNLPKSIKSFIYFDAFDHLATSMLELLLGAGRRITKTALENFNLDVQYLENFIGNVSAGGNEHKDRRRFRLTGGTRENPSIIKHRSEEDAYNSLLTTFTELRQTIDFILSPDLEEYNNPEIRMRKYGRVKPHNASVLAEKLFAPPAPPPTPSRSMRFRRANATVQ
ncbi:exocyst complex subunit Sec15-like-domain-containing protein [Lipomyces arxii]|uniref:exocyst complex subunit Sec15-like-domain-containing protein n=1 Tax=Lipomyces arxii TaxID=56418 RepID=UPI0034CD7EB5